MADWEFAIAVADEEDLSSGHRRKKQGDIIAVKPAPWAWGQKETMRYLIVPVSGLTEAEARALCQPYYEGGIKKENLPTDPGSVMPQIAKKRRYAIPIDIIKDGWCPDLRIEDVANKDVQYQPLKDRAITVDFTEHVAICLDRHTNTYKYARRKG